MALKARLAGALQEQPRGDRQPHPQRAFALSPGKAPFDILEQRVPRQLGPADLRHEPEGTGKYSGIKGNNTYRYTGIGNTSTYSVVWEGEWQLP